MSSRRASDNSSNSFLYNAGTELNATNGWYETMFRGYDAALGRFMSVDPLATATHSMSTYQYANGNPVVMNDPTGLKAHMDVTVYWVPPDFSQSVMPGSGNHWSDGMGQFSDWNPNDGSNMYRQAIGAGAIEIGGKFYMLDQGERHEVSFKNGEMGYWVDEEYVDYEKDEDGNWYKYQYAGVRSRFITTGQDEYQNYLNDFVKQNFGAEHDDLLALAAKTGQKLVWWIDGEGKQLNSPFEHGLTQRDKNDSKKVRITVHGYTVLKAIVDKDTNMLYHVIAHEFVHARDLLDGKYDAWSKWYGAEMAYEIMEHHAYTRSIEVEKQLNYYIGAFHAQMKFIVPENYLDPTNPCFQ